MNAIIYSYININGSLIEVLEYYLFMKKYNIDINLIILDVFEILNLNDLYLLIEDRYDIRFEYKSNIIIKKSRINVKEYNFNHILIVDWGTIKTQPIIFNYNKLHILYEENGEKYKKIYSNLTKLHNCVVYNEMPFGVGKKYINKFAFELYKEILPIHNNTYYVNCLSKGISTLEELSNRYHNTKLMVCVSTQPSKNYTNITYYYKHPKDFFSLFDTYVYIHDNKYFDPRPRCFVEARYYNKKIIYINSNNIKDGSWYRYYDKYSDERNLSIDDEIIKEFNNVKT